jgi:hypothetical protein
MHYVKYRLRQTSGFHITTMRLEENEWNKRWYENLHWRTDRTKKQYQVTDAIGLHIT